MLTVGDQFPSFHLKAVVSSNISTAFMEASNEDNANSWKVFFFYPKDFTFICPTEIIAYSDLVSAFEKNKTTVYGVSTDSEFVHLAWRQSHPGLNTLKLPLLSDIRRELSEALGILDEKEGVCLRATFIVDPENYIRSVVVNDLNVGRNVQETLRTLEALQTGELTPCNWNPGDAVLTVS